MKRIHVTVDSLFKHIFGGGNQASIRTLRFILETFLDIKVYSIRQLSSNVTTGRNEKKMIADVLLLVNDKHFVIIEMQNQKKDDNNERFTSYESVITMFRNEKGQPYNIGKNYILVFTGYHVRNDKVVDEGIICHRFSDGYMYSDKYIIKIVELVGLRELAKKSVASLTRKERCKLFIRYLNDKQFPQYKKLIAEIVESEEELKMTLAEIFKATNEEDWPHEFLKWKNEEQLRREDEYEIAKERELKKAKKKARKATLHVKELVKQQVKIEKSMAVDKKKIVEIAKKNEEIAMKKAEAEKAAKEAKQEALRVTKAMEFMTQGFSQEEALRKATIYINKI